MLIQNIKELCYQNRISIETLERNAGLGLHTIYRWKDGNASLNNLIKVADYFGVSIDDLVRGNYEENTETEYRQEHG